MKTSIKQELERNARDILTLPAYLRPGRTWEKASDENLEWLIDYYREQISKIEDIQEDRLYNNKASCGCRYRLMYEYGTRGEGASKVVASDRYSRFRCAAHTTVDSYDLSVQIARNEV